MQENRNMDMGAAAGVGAQSGIHAGMKRSTHYKIEMFSPIPIALLESKIRELLPTKRPSPILHRLMRHVIERDGVAVVPYAAILGCFRSVPESLRAWLQLQPTWVEEFDNLVTTAGLNDSLDKHFKGSSYTAAWYVGLTQGSPTFNAADTAASHSGWTESTAYSESVRQTLTLGSVSAGSVDNSASKAVFSINATATVGGAFVTTLNTKSGSTGVLYGGGAFSGGNRSLLNGDSLSITITLTAS